MLCCSTPRRWSRRWSFLMERRFQADPWTMTMIEARQTTRFGRKRRQRRSCGKVMRVILSLFPHGHPTDQPKQAASQRCRLIPRLSRCTTSNQSRCAARPSRCNESGIPSSFSHTKQRHQHKRPRQFEGLPLGGASSDNAMACQQAVEKIGHGLLGLWADLALQQVHVHEFVAAEPVHLVPR